MSKHITYRKTFGRFYEAYRNFCRDNFPTSKPTSEDKVVEVGERAERGVVIPHFRRGYFKRLSSDYFKNKKGHIIFVHETIVNGQAKTLEKI